MAQKDVPNRKWQLLLLILYNSSIINEIRLKYLKVNHFILSVIQRNVTIIRRNLFTSNSHMVLQIRVIFLDSQLLNITPNYLLHQIKIQPIGIINELLMSIISLQVFIQLVFLDLTN